LGPSGFINAAAVQNSRRRGDRNDANVEADTSLGCGLRGSGAVLGRGVRRRRSGRAGACGHATARSAVRRSRGPELGHYFGNSHSHVLDNAMSYERSGAPVFFDAEQGKRIAARARAYVKSGELVPVPLARGASDD
jgi:hypothetical protein